MAKSSTQNQGAFSFLDEVEKSEPLPKAKRNTLRPPEQIEVSESIEPASKEDQPDKGPVMERGQASISQKDPEPQVSTPDQDSEPVQPTPSVAKPEAKLGAVSKLAQKKVGNSRGRRSVRENSLAADAIEMPDDATLFQKHYYSMGEVTAMFKENHSLIRYWESEFDILKPKKNGKGDRFFRPVDVKNLYLIYDLLRRRKYTIEGAREFLKNNRNADEKYAAVQSLQKIKEFLLELKAGI